MNITMNEDDVSNRGRFETLKEGVKALFNKVSVDIERAKNNARGVKLIDDKLARIKQRYPREIYALEQANQERAREEAAVTLIAGWAGAAALKVCPEIVDDCDPDIEHDVSRMLISAEVAFEELGGDMDCELMRLNNQALKEDHGMSDTQCDVYNALESAEAILQMFRDI